MWKVSKEVIRIGRKNGVRMRYILGLHNLKFKYRFSAILYIKFVAYWDGDEYDPFAKDKDIIITYTLSYE